MKLSQLIATSKDHDVTDCAKLLIERHELFSEDTPEVYFDAYWKIDLDMDCGKCKFFDVCEVCKRNE